MRPAFLACLLAACAAGTAASTGRPWAADHRFAAEERGGPPVAADQRVLDAAAGDLARCLPARRPARRAFRLALTVSPSGGVLDAKVESEEDVPEFRRCGVGRSSAGGVK